MADDNTPDLPSDANASVTEPANDAPVAESNPGTDNDASVLPGDSTPAPNPSSEPGPISDNPLDAPDGPRPEAEDADGAGEDEEMADAGNDTKKEPESQDAAEGAEAPAATKASLETAARSHLIAQTHSIILPSYCAWFDMRLINNLEKKALPEFFNSRNRSKTPAVYKDYRDFMVNTYRLNPAEYLTVTACRRNLAGDVCAIMRVHSFLEQWGLINYQVDPDTRPSTIAPPFTGHFRITADTPRGLQPHQPAPNSIATSGKPFAATERLANAQAPSKSDLNLEIRRNIYDSNGKDVTPSEAKEKPSNGDAASANGSESEKKLEEALKEPTKQCVCNSCAVDCTRVRYHNSKSAVPASGKQVALTKHDLCPSCFLEGRFPQNCSASDYVKLENEKYTTIPDRDAPWTAAETLLLLEALEVMDDDWNAISDHVGSRTREECVAKFLQMEIEDKYLDQEPGAGSEEKTNGTLAYLGQGRVPFTRADNPVMSVMAFMAALAPPSVTSAAAGRAISEMNRLMRKQLEEGYGADDGDDTGKGKEKADSAPVRETVKDEDSMDVDTHSTSTTAVKSAAVSGDNSEPNLYPEATMTLASAGSRGGAFASHEERNIARLVSTANNVMLQKVELKLQQFSELEAALAHERRELERRRQQFFLEKLALRKRMDRVVEAFSHAVTLSPVEGQKVVKEAVNAPWDVFEAKSARKAEHGDGKEGPPGDGDEKTVEL
ncbi:SWIRM-domain-containing protein [Aulographum hederae CBS 113979]|uniref:SWIRM-domain-containing protein n=1 Tax=Aulographum hederae CBS 113979 TaxID=1176131 RepID=A0A6G1HGC7_9PEZI|nr:SWIRM-domain-containing protein [Aulographum hederae CBS 113979]